ncbi:MAG: thiamine phosphate synthase [Ignavibacteriota bacterium]
MGTPLIVDDRADFAMLLDAGLHVGQDDLAPRDARKLIGDEATLGYSSHNLGQLVAAGGEPVDYVAIGPIFATSSKRNPDPVVGVDEIRSCRALIEKPLVAIGGYHAGKCARGLGSGRRLGRHYRRPVALSAKCPRVARAHGRVGRAQFRRPALACTLLWCRP